MIRSRIVTNVAAVMGGAPPLAFGTPLYVMGDSISDESYSPVGYIARVKAKTKGRYVIPPGGNRGSAGSVSGFGLLDLPLLQSLWTVHGAGVVIMMFGTNSDNPITDIVTNVPILIQACLDAGHRVVWNVTPHNASATTDSLRAAVAAQFGSDPRVATVRLDTAITNTGAGDQSAGMTYDSTHFNDEGSDVASDLIAAVLDGWSAVPSQSLFTSPATSMIDNTFAGTAGTVNSPCTGSMPTGWSITRFSGDGTVAVAIEDLVTADGTVKALRVTIGAGTTATKAQIARSVTSISSPSIDDHFDGYFGFKQVSGTLSGVEWQMDSTNAGSVGGSPAYVMTRLTDDLIWRGNPKPRNAVVTSFTNWFFFTAQAGQPAEVLFWLPTLTRRTVPNYSPVTRTGAGATNLPLITGTATNGSTLTVVPKTWSGKPLPVVFTYQWKAAGVDISGATSITYVLTAGEVGKKITCLVTGTDATGANSWLTPQTATVT